MQLSGVFFKKKVFLGFSEISREKTFCLGLFLMALPALGSESLLKIDSDAGVFLWDLRNLLV